MSKHTPGPLGIKADTYTTLVTTDNNPPWGHTARCYGDNQIADARLYAAAPELLEACKAALGVFPAPDQGEGSSYYLAYRLLETAIAKAEGEE